MKILESLTKLRGEERSDIDQKYLTMDSIIDRMDVMMKEELVADQRILALGDSDMAGIALSIFGSPHEVVIVDIDRRISEILFEANMDFDLPVRFVYHDMRIKLIEILFHQYTLIILEPPPTKAGIEVFLSRALQCIQEGFEDNIIVSIPGDDVLRTFFEGYISNLGIVILSKYESLNKFMSGGSSDLYRLKVPNTIKPTVDTHWILPFYSHEVTQEEYEYRCMCHEIITIGPNHQFQTLDQLKNKGHTCGHKDPFSFHSKIPLL